MNMKMRQLDNRLHCLGFSVVLQLQIKDPVRSMAPMKPSIAC